MVVGVTGCSPAGNTSVTIAGTNRTGATAVKFGGTNATAYVVNGPTQIRVIEPAGGAGTVVVSVAPAGAPSAASPNDHYTYFAIPTVSSIAPTSGPATGGTSVIITGSNLTAATAVKFGAANPTSYTVNSAAQITPPAPSRSALAAVTVTTPT